MVEPERSHDPTTEAWRRVLMGTDPLLPHLRGRSAPLRVVVLRPSATVPS